MLFVSLPEAGQFQGFPSHDTQQWSHDGDQPLLHTSLTGEGGSRNAPLARWQFTIRQEPRYRVASLLILKRDAFQHAGERLGGRGWYVQRSSRRCHRKWKALVCW